MKYQDICPIDTSKKERNKYNVGNVFENKAQCLVCEEIIMSENKHHYNTCKCGNLSVDGGSWYLKRNFEKKDSYKELSTWYKEI